MKNPSAIPGTLILEKKALVVEGTYVQVSALKRTALPDCCNVAEFLVTLRETWLTVMWKILLFCF